MPLQGTHLPKLCRHKGKNRAFVRFNGITHYCGRWGSAESREKYDALIRQWIDNGRVLSTCAPSTPATSDSYTIDALCADYLEFATGYYIKNAAPTDEVACVRAVIRTWVNLFPMIPVSTFGPKSLKQVRDEMIRLGHSRRTINSNVNRVRRIIAWGIEEEKVKGEILYAVRAVKGLRRGRSGAKEGEPVRPVPQVLIDATLLHCNRQVRAMVELQLATGMRPGEVVIMRQCDLTRQTIWKYTPAYHKTEGYDIIRQIPLGPRAQATVNQFLRSDLKAYLFSPADAVEDQRAARREDRKTPMYPSHMNRPSKDEPKWATSAHFDVDSYRRAITRACDRAAHLPEELLPDSVRATWPRRKKLKQTMGTQRFSQHHEKVQAWYADHRWSPNQLRHNFATMVRRQYGLDVAQVLLGHQHADVTQIYAERDFAKASEVAGMVG